MKNTVQVVGMDLQQRIDTIKLFASSSNVEVLEIADSDVKYFNKFVFAFDNKKVEFHIILKNIVNSGWANKPYIKRIQIASLAALPLHRNTKGVYSCLMGVVRVGEQLLLVVWNPFRFVFHKTNRSCYVWDKNLETAIYTKGGFYKTIDSAKEIIICDQYHFDRLLRKYIERNEIYG